MFTVWTPATEVSGRLNPEFYRSEYVENERRLGMLGPCEPLAALCDEESPITNGIRGPDLADTDFRMLRLQDVDALWIDSSRSLRVSEDQFDANSRASCQPGDILVAIGGYIGIVGKVIDDAPQTMGQHAARLRLSQEKVDRDFVLAFLASDVGKQLFQRYVTGGVQAGINLEDVREIRLPIVKREIQAAIGRKIQKAELLKAEFERLLNEAKADVHDLVNGSLDEDSLLEESDTIAAWLAEQGDSSEQGGST